MHFYNVGHRSKYTFNTNDLRHTVQDFALCNCLWLTADSLENQDKDLFVSAIQFILDNFILFLKFDDKLRRGNIGWEALGCQDID